MMQKSAREIAKGKWRGILMHMGVPEKHLIDKHGPCPMCGGKDRFRFDNKEGAGTWFCSQCGAGDGFELAEKYTGMTFAAVAAEVERICGASTMPVDKSKPALSEEQRKAALRQLVANSRKVERGDLVDAYLTARGLGEVTYPEGLRFAPKIQNGEGGIGPAMLAIVQGADGKNVTIHRTFLSPDGRSKALIASPRKLMPGPMPEGSAVRLSEWLGSGPLGIAEGIETAMAASALYRMPVWAAINEGNLARWKPPEGCTEVEIFGDWDANFVGHSAAYALARRLAIAGLDVGVHIPNPPMGFSGSSYDWLDHYQRTHRGSKAA